VKKRVLQLIGSFHQGGTERQAVSLTRLLKDEGSFDVFAATLNNEGVLRSEIDKLGLPEIPEFPLTSFFNANFVSQVRRCAEYLLDNKIDIIHAHDFYTNVFGMAATTIAKIPVRIASKRETGGMRSSAQDFVEKIAFKRASAIVANSAAVKEHLIARGITSSKVRIIYNGIDLERFGFADDRASVCRRFGLPADEKVRFVTLVANLRHKVKNVPMLLRAAKRLTENHADVHFVIAGEGALEAELKQQAQRVGVAEKVHFIGRCTDVQALLLPSSACVLTSTAEGFSNSILEYMAAGKPVVATGVGGAAEAIADGETGFLVASDDDAEMAERLAELLVDDIKLAQFGVNGKNAIAERFSSKIQLIKTLELYNDLLQR
jgi:L-malate glycosyltransferase